MAGDSTGLSIRRLGLADLPLLLAARDVFDHAVQPVLAQRFLAHPDHHLVGAVENGRLLGIVSAVTYLHPDKPLECWINEIGVAASQQRRGIGRQLVQAMLADCQTEIFAARSMTLEAARKRDNGESVTMEASCCKYFSSEMCGRVADRAVQVHGGAGYMADSPIERFYRDVRLFRLYEGTSQIQQLVIARQLIRNAGR